MPLPDDHAGWMKIKAAADGCYAAAVISIDFRHDFNDSGIEVVIRSHPTSGGKGLPNSGEHLCTFIKSWQGLALPPA